MAAEAIPEEGDRGRNGEEEAFDFERCQLRMSERRGTCDVRPDFPLFER